MHLLLLAYVLAGTIFFFSGFLVSKTKTGSMGLDWCFFRVKLPEVCRVSWHSRAVWHWPLVCPLEGGMQKEKIRKLRKKTTIAPRLEAIPISNSKETLVSHVVPS